MPGRFQPPHKGHIEAIKWVLGRSRELIIAVCSAQKSHSLENPFTAGERIWMIREALIHENIDLSRIIIAPVQDIEYNSVWVSYLESLLPPFQAVASRNPLVKRLFRERGYTVLEPPLVNRGVYSGVFIRKLMLEGKKEWKNLVPEPVCRIIDEIKGVERIKDISTSDEVIKA